MTPENFIKAQLLLLAYREAWHDGGVNNMLAVMHVMRNRVNGGWNGGDWLQVMEWHQLATCNERKETFTMLPNLRNPEIRIVLNRVDDIFNGQEPDAMTDGALYYARLDQPLTEWFKQNIANHQEEHPRVAKIGQVDFFR